MNLNFISFIFCSLFLFVFIEAEETLINNHSQTNKKKYHVKVINLESRPDRWETIQSLWSQYFDLERVDPVSHARNIPACSLSNTHVHLLSQFSNSEDNYLMVMEDDAFPPPYFNISEFTKIHREAMRTPFWQVMNFGPWFTYQPIVEPVSKHLVQLDYFHTAHFIMYHRRILSSKTARRFQKEYDKHQYCIPIDDYFGNYNQRSDTIAHAVIIAPKKTQALQNLKGESTVGGGPSMNLCAINAALAGRYVHIEIEVSKDPIRIPPKFQAPLYGYKKDIQNGTFELVYTEDCNIENDDYDIYLKSMNNSQGSIPSSTTAINTKEPIQPEKSKKTKKKEKTKRK